MFDSPFFKYGAGNTYLAVACIGLGLFAFSLLVEVYRRYRGEHERVAEEWRGVEAVMREKDLSGEQQALVRAMLKRSAPKHPYKAITQRDLFNDGIRLEMKRNAGKPVDALNQLGEMWRNIRQTLMLEFVPSGQNISHTRDIYLDQKVWFAGTAQNQEAAWHAARVTHVNEAYFVIVPEVAVNPPANGSLLPLRMWRDDDARYAFDAEVVRTDNQPAGWLMCHTDELERKQARSHYRIRMDQTVELHVLELPPDGPRPDGLFSRPAVATFSAHLVNLSGGGFAISIVQPLPAQVLLRTELQLDEHPVRVLGRIVGSQDLHGGRYLVRCAFTGMLEESREQVAQYVQRRQTQLAALPV